ncbi:hypothetical protein HanHA300_Chr12g0455511 [Helianthus annuus]|nr:hypothetical protein HanHA300_Chr12g0455511 [Helianthus annuus]KAJ0494647.1 hypothetical protein HanIR_Chr12g0599821 [Helianthus annuus]KAJ0506360.1 hypothetical protein HanHA89_Chr12g0481081 [Helianthus annuus]KAJ0676036.1 hypothetical protein HanLR1_Chr12g0458051 [Helianthus annuus]KAJ0679278.1 hypothetical protein HanOQP8_Chr12g0457571 [Helianthus annuus]
MDMSNIPSFDDHSQSHSDDQSSGYLEDALYKFTSKRRRLLLFDDDMYWKLNSQEYDNPCKGFPKFRTDNNGVLMSERHLNISSTEAINTLNQTSFSQGKFHFHHYL